MPVVWCQPCKARGRLAVAHHEVAGTLMCDECFREKPSKGVKTELAAEVLKKKAEEKTMRTQTVIDESLRESILKDHKNGMSVEAIRKARGMAWYVVKRIVGGNGAPAAKRGRPAGHSSVRSMRGAANGNGAMTAMEELCEALWAALPLEKKAALLKEIAQQGLQ